MRRAMIRNTSVRAAMKVMRKASSARRASSSIGGAEGRPGAFMGAPSCRLPGPGATARARLHPEIVERDVVDDLAHARNPAGERLDGVALQVGTGVAGQEYHAVGG